MSCTVFYATRRFRRSHRFMTRETDLLRKGQLHEEFVERAKGQDLPVIDDPDAGAEPGRFFHVVS